MTASRRRQTLLKSQQNGIVSSSAAGASTGNAGGSGVANGGRMTERQPTTRVINAAPSLEKAEMYGIDDDRPVFSRVMALAGRMFIETIPQWLAVGAMLSLIFGGCCSNVFALEAIVKVEPASGRFFLLRWRSGRVPDCGLQLANCTGLRDSLDVCAVPVRHRHQPAFAV
jgi:UDP-xylose/UDP-N-acetylglucosamine transporter B4